MSSQLLKQPILEGATSQNLRTLAQRLSAYIPVTLTRKLLQDEPLTPGVAKQIQAATMFADMSGFTQMAEALSVNGARGTEALSRALLMTFTSLINAIHDAGGVVSHFHGDAMMIYFPDNDGRASSRALASAQFMQRLMQTNFTQVNMLQPDGGYALSIKIGVGYGRCLELLVGNSEKMEFVLAGQAVDEAVAAQMQAEAGQVIASQAVLKAANLPAPGPFRLITELPPVPNAQEGFFWEAYDSAALMRLITAVPAFIPPSVFERLQDRSSQSISEHRSVTSMFVQFEGLDFDDPDVGSKLQTYYQWAWQMVKRYGGPNSRVNRVLTGDKGNQLHILFGAPVAPDAPVQAVRCALAMQKNRPDFIQSQHIGLTVGRVFAGAVGSLNRREYTVVGRMVNLSARLTQICPAGTILIDAKTAARIQPQIITESLPPVPLKGHREPVPVYKAVDEQTAVTQAEARFSQWQQPPGGREQELNHLYKKMADAMAGKGGLIAIHGSYGSGQMPFLAAGVHHWLDLGGHALVGMCQQHTSDVPYAPWVSVWRDFFELSSEVSPAEQEVHVARRIEQLTPTASNGLALWRELLGTPLRATGLLLDLPAVVRQMRLFKLVVNSVRLAVQERPYLIVLEDIHFADQASLAMLTALIDHSHDLPLLLLVTYRSDTEFSFRPLNQGILTQIELNDFTPQQARNLVQARLGTTQLPPLLEQRLGLRDRQGRESAVNPLFLEETLQMLLSLDVVAHDSNRYGDGRLRIDEVRLSQMQVSDTIYTLLLSRLDQLPAAERGLLQYASVIGREFDLPTLVAISPSLTRETAVELLEALARADLVQQLTSGLVPTYLFQHTLIHQVVYQSLTFARRQSLHATIADLIIRQADELMPTQFPLLAYHFSQTDQHQDGLKYSVAAAKEAEKANNYQGAADFYKQAAKHLESLGEAAASAPLNTVDQLSAGVAIGIARTRNLLRLGKFDKAWLLANEALHHCLDETDLHPTLSINNLMAEIRLRQARYTELPNLVSKVINSPLEASPEAKAQAYLLWAQSLIALADWEAAAEKLARAEEILQPLEQVLPLVAVLIAQADIQSQQRPAYGLPEPLQVALKLLKTESDPLLLGQAQQMLSQVQMRLGQPDLALAAAETAVTNLRSAGANPHAHGLVQRAAVHIYLGNFAEALADLQLAGDLFDGMDDTPGRLKLYLLWGNDYHGGLGDWRQARRRLVRVGQLLKAHPKDDGMVVQEGIRFWLSLGQVALNTGRWPQAEKLLRQVLTAVQPRRLVWWQPAAYHAWGRLLLACTPTDAPNWETAVAEAHSYFQKAFQAVEDGGCPDELSLILLQLGLTSRALGDERCWHYLETAVQTAQQRARFADRQIVLQQAGEALQQASNEHLQQLGQQAVALIISVDMA
ncbi:adenylate/guanylate cyclase domain-containing protein [Candidatus Leptofilum sp.]|uniref:adenylate/guanylate cyclase domain-containing protein n=1 Tax=Candidatus Leptofilum sp. TaxID=3241576 RepID=UPI003B5A689C